MKYNNCGTCRWGWYFPKVDTSTDDDYDQFFPGECHRHAPQPSHSRRASDSDMRFTYWPQVEPHDGCGDWTARND